MAKKVIVGGRIESKEVGGIVTGAAGILDDTKGKKQSVINQETDAEMERLDGAKQDVLTFDNAPTENSNNPVKSGGVYAADKALSDAIEAILLLIPSAASALNKLVDQATMNSSISTATATFRGTFNVVSDLRLTVEATHEQIAAKLAQVVSEADNNDYAFVQIPVSDQSTDIRRTERYKFNGTAWAYEYDLNTSGFTAAQWAAINSGITLALVAKLSGLPTSSELMALLGQKQDTLTFDNIPTSGSANPVKSGGVYSAINDEKTAREQLAQSVAGINGRLGNVEEVIPSGAAANNKLVANSSMESYVASIIDAITASFTIATADGHINLTLTQTNGRVASLTLTSSDIASAQALTALTGRVSTAEGNITTINGNITTLGGRVSTNETDIANLQQLYNDLQQSKPVPVTALPSTGQQQSVIYRLAGTTSYSDYMWNGSSWVLMATYNNAIDPRPKKASQNLVTSGGVFDNMGALDVSELNATENPHTLAQYVDLSDALAAVPTDYQKGGMSIKFVQSSDNKYVQFFNTKNEWSIIESDWQKIDLGERLFLNGDIPTLIGTTLTLYSSDSIWGTTGSIEPADYTRAINQKIPVISGEDYEIKNMQGDAYTSGLLRFYDKDDLLISQIDFGQDASDVTVTAPNNAVWIGLTMNKYVAETNITGVKVIGKLDTGKVKIPTLQLLPENMPESYRILEDSDAEYDINIDVLPDILSGKTLTSAADGTYYNGNGEVVTNPYDLYTNAIVPIIDVSAEQTYIIKKFYGTLMFLDSYGHNGVQISCTTGDLFQLNDYTFTVPSGKTKVGITYNRSVVKNINDIKILKQTLSQEELKQQPVVFGNVLNYFNNFAPSIQRILFPFYGKKIVFMGHSLVGNANPPYDITSIINSMIGSDAKNCAFGGSTVSRHEDANYDKFALYNLVDAIISNDFTEQESALPNVPAIYADHLTVLETIDFSNVDILVFCSVENDIRNAKAISNPNNPEDTDTVIGAYNYVLRRMMTQYPNLSIFLCSPHYEYYTATSQDSDTYTNSLGLKASDYMEAMDEMAHKKEIPFIDIYNIGVNKYNWNTYLDDGFHFTEKGKILFSKVITKLIF